TGGPGHGDAVALPPPFGVGAGVGLLGGVDGRPEPHAGDVARPDRSPAVAALAGSDPGAEGIVGDALARPGGLRWSGGVGRRRRGSGAGAALGGPFSRRGEGAPPGGECRSDGRGPSGRGGPAAVGRRSSTRAAGSARGAAGARALAAVSYRPGDPAGAREGRGSADRLRVVELRRGPAELLVWGGVPQGYGAEPDGAEQRHLSGEAEDQ